MGTLNLAMCAGGNGFSVFKFDPARRRGRHARGPGGIANPTLERSVQVPEIGGGPAHSGSFTYDGKVLIFGWEPGGGTQSALPGQSLDLAERQPAVLLRPGDRHPARAP